MVGLDSHLVESREHVSARVLSATNEEGRTEGGKNPIKLVTDGIKQGNQSNYLEKVHATGDNVNVEDAIDVDDNDGKLTKPSQVSDQASETMVSDIFASRFFCLLNFWCKSFIRFRVMLKPLYIDVYVWKWVVHCL